MADYGKITRAAIRAVEEYLDKCPKLEPYIDSNDKNPLWDGDIIVYSDENHNISNLISRIPVIVKGTIDTSSIDYYINRKIIEAYNNIGGGIFFLIKMKDNSEEILYSFLSVYEIDILSRQSSQSIKIALQEVPSNPLDFEKEVLKFAVDRNKYKRNELWYESQYVSSLKTECENLSAYINDMKNDREELESILNSIKRYDRGDFTEFFQDIKRIIEIVQDNKIDNPVLLMNLTMDFASLLQEQNEFDKAVQYFKEAQKYALELADQNYYNKGELYESTEKLVDLYNEANEQDVLVETLSKTIRNYKELCKKDPISYTELLANSCLSLAENYWQKDKYRKAEKYYNDAFNLFILLTQSDEEKYIKTVLDILIKLCRIHKRFREYQEAKKDNTEALDILKDYNTSNFDPIKKTMVLAESANLNKELNNFEEAENEYSQSLEDFNSLNNNTNEYNYEKACVLASYADLYSKKGNVLDAEVLFTESVNLYHEIGDSTTDIIANKARAYFMYGNFYASSNPKEAENKYKNALSIQEKIKSTDKYVPDYIDTLFALIRLNPGDNDSSNRLDKSLELLYELIKKDPEENAAFLKIFLRISTELYKNIRIGNRESIHFDKVEEKYESCLNICRELEKNNQEEYEEYVVDVLRCLARFYLASEKYEDAENRYKELLDKCRKIAEHRTDYNINVALSLIDLGKFYQIYPNHNSDAETYFDEALEILQKLEMIGHDKYGAEIAETYYNLGNLYRSLERKSEAEAQFDKALKRYRSLSINNSKEYNEKVAQTAENIAYLIIDDENRKNDATKALKEALNIYQQFNSQLENRYKEKISQLNEIIHRLEYSQNDSILGKMQRKVIRIVEEYINKCPKLDVNLNNYPMSFLRGDIFAYDENENGRRYYQFRSVPLVVKSTAIIGNNYYRIERDHLLSFKAEFGIVFFLVQNNGNDYNILYTFLSFDKLESLLSQSSKFIKVLLNEVPDDPLIFEKEVFEFLDNKFEHLMKELSNAKRNELGSLSIKNIDNERYISKIIDEDAKSRFVSILSILKNIKEDGTSSWRDKYIYYYQSALDLLSNYIDSEEFYRLQYKFGEYLHEQKQYHLVEDIYKKTLKGFSVLAKDNHIAYDPDVAMNLNKLGELHRTLTRYTEATDEYKAALDIYRELAKTNPDAYKGGMAMTLNKIGELHVTLDRYSEAADDYKAALDIYRELAKINREAYIGDVAGTLNNLGNLHSNLTHYDKAEEEYMEALEIYRELAKTNRDAYIADVAMTLNNLGELHRVLIRYAEAEMVYKEALDIYRELAKSNRDAYIGDVAMTLNYLAILHEDLTRFDEAEKEYKEALEIRRELAKTNRDVYIRYVAKTLNNLAHMHYNLNRYDEAELEYKEALEIYREQAKNNRDAYIGDVAMTLNNLAILHDDLTRYEEAELEFKEALEIRRELAKTNRDVYIRYVAMTLNNLAHVHNNLTRYAEAEEEYKEALEIYLELAKTNPDAYIGYVATTLNNLGNLHYNLTRYAEAEEEYKEALEIYRELAKTNRDAYIWYVAKTLIYLANIHKDLTNYEVAEEEYKEALEICRELAATNRDAYIGYVAITLHNIALLQEETDRKAEAKKTAEEALGIYKELAMAYPQIWNRYLEMCERLLERIGSFNH